MPLSELSHLKYHKRHVYDLLIWSKLFYVQKFNKKKLFNYIFCTNTSAEKYFFVAFIYAFLLVQQ